MPVYTLNEYKMFNFIEIENALIYTGGGLDIIYKWPVPRLSTEDKNNTKNDYYV